MAKNDINTPVTDAQDAVTELVEEAPVEEAVPAVKTKKEIKKERKEIKKHKKEVKKEAKRHSAKRTKAQNFFLGVLSVLVIVCLVVCCVTAIKITMNIGSSSSSSASSASSSSSSAKQTSAATPASATPSSSAPSNSTPSEPASGDAAAPADSAASGDLSTPAGVVEYYKTAYAKVLSDAKTANHTYNNTLNYNDVLDIDGNSTIAGVAKTLMGMFMKEETNLASYTGGDIAANFPGAHIENLTADMLSEATCVEDGNNYVLTLKVNSTEEDYDLGDKTGSITDIVSEQEVMDAAGSMVKLTGLENHYIGATVKATIDKATGNMIQFESDVPSYMCFSEAKVAIISVKNCRIGLEYIQTWTMEY